MPDAAEQVFEERGFAGARVDDTAARAGMSKSQIYYHLRGKQAIFDELVQRRIGEIFADKEVALAEQDGNPGSDPAGLADHVRTPTERLLVPRGAFLRIVLPDGLGKTGDGDTLLMRVIRPLLDDSLRRFEELGFPVDRGRAASDIFHFTLVPTIVHVALGGRWARARDVEPGRSGDLHFDSLRILEREFLARVSGTATETGRGAPRGPERSRKRGSHDEARHRGAGSCQGVRAVACPGRAGSDPGCRRGARLPGPERRGEVNHDPLLTGPAAPGRQRGTPVWA